MPVSNDSLDPTDSVVPGASDTPDSIAVKHAVVTYSRKRQAFAENGVGSASCSAERDRLCARIRLSMADELHPGSELSCISAETEEREADELCDDPPEFVFPWKQKLEEWSDQEECDSPPLSSNKHNASVAEQFFMELSEAHEISHSSKEHSLELPKERTWSGDALVESPVVETVTSPSTPSIGSNRRRPIYRAVVRDSESESEPSHANRGSSANKLSPFVFQTPNSRSSPTPPTSADEMPSLSSSKRGKASVAPRRSVPPLLFSEEPLSGAESGNIENFSSNKHRKALKVKAPTKKERLETAKDSVRLAANQSISISNVENSCKFTLQNFLAYLTENQTSHAEQASDPILPFSSSPSGFLTVETPISVSQHNAGSPRVLDHGDTGTHSNTQGPPDGELLSAEKDNKIKELQTIKQRALVLQSIRIKADVDEDDLEIVADDELPPFKQFRPARARKQDTSFKVVTLTKPERSTTGLVTHVETKYRNPGLGVKGGAPLTQAELSRMLVGQVTEHNKRLMAQKDEEWVKRGGRLRIHPTGDNRDALSTYLQKGLENSVMNSEAGLLDEYEESCQGQPLEWNGDGSETIDGDGRTNVHRTTEGDLESDQEPVDDEMAEEAPRIKKRNRKNVAVLDSESESEEHPMTSSLIKDPVFKFGHSSLGSLVGTDESDENSMPPPTLSFSSIHRGYISSVDADDQSEDRSDKENNRKLMFDRSEDKENKVIVRYNGHISPEGLLNAGANSLLFSNAKDLEGEDVLRDERSPFTVLSEDKSSVLQRDLLWTDSSSPQSRRSISPISHLGELTSSSRVTSFGVPRLLQTGFAELFESGTEGPKKDQPLLGSLELTQDIRLQPAFNPSDQLLLRRADSIFEKEQAYLLEASNKKCEKKQLYVNDFGFLTQTRPRDEAVEPYKSPYFTQRKDSHRNLSDSPTKDSERHPLGTLSLSVSVGLEGPISAPRRRLVKRSTPTPSRFVTMRNSNSSTPAPLLTKNVFDTLVQGSKYLARREKHKLGKSEFVESEAEESDDDDVFNFLPKKNDEDEEEDSNDLDQTLDALVDDRHMDAEMLNAPLVIEKFKEDMEREDQELENLHQAAAQGELRRKRRNRGIGLDDSDEESDEDERVRKIRRKMNKSQRIDRGDIRALAKNEETLPFYKTYEHGILDDDDVEFQQTDAAMGEAVDNSGQDARSLITMKDIEHDVRRLARQKEIEPTLDPHDVSWIDAEISDEEAVVQVRAAGFARRKVNIRGGLDKDLDDISKLPASIVEEQEKSRMQSWAKIEGKLRSTTVRSGGGVAVTGHAKSKVKVDMGCLSTALQGSSRRKPLKPTPSVLADVSDRSARFAN
ncbi:hypothetical protein AX15_002470 [Amanita polypyramis BW_CC]|nr:hypothetical protein AX15_002470 [Amanita polypyramis BW_CC]